MAKVRSAQEVVAKALWADGNNRIGHRPWDTVKNAYMAEAGHAIAALRACGFHIVHEEGTPPDELLDRWRTDHIGSSDDTPENTPQGQ